MKINTILESEGSTYNYELDGELNDNVLTYNENGIKVKLDINKNYLHRESDIFIMDYSFNVGEETINNIYMKEMDKNIEIPIYTVSISKKIDTFEVIYRLEDDKEIKYTVNFGG